MNWVYPTTLSEHAMKKIIVAVVVALCVSTMVGCGGNTGTSNSKPVTATDKMAK